MPKGFLYLIAIIDFFSCNVVGRENPIALMHPVFFLKKNLKEKNHQEEKLIFISLLSE